MSTWARSCKVNRNSPAFRERIVDAGPLPMPADVEPEVMPRTQMIALLTIRAKTAGKDSLFAKVLTCLMAVGSDDATQDDRYALLGAGLIVFDYATQDWKLLPRGLHKAEMIAREMAKLYCVHHVTFNFKLPRSSTASFASCSCGGWCQTVTRKRGDDDRLRRLAADHLDSVARGTWKRPRPIQEFLNEYMPLRLPLSVATLPDQSKAGRAE